MDEQKSQPSGVRPSIHDEATPGSVRPSIRDEAPASSARPRIQDEATPSGVRPRIHEEAARTGEPGINGGSSRESGALVDTQLRVLDERPQDGEEANEAEQQVREAGREVGSLAGAWGIPGTAALTTPVHFAVAWQRGLSRFFSLRIAKNLEYAGRLAAVRSPQEVFQLNSRFAREFLLDLTHGVGSIAEQSPQEARQLSSDAPSQTRDSAGVRVFAGN